MGPVDGRLSVDVAFVDVVGVVPDVDRGRVLVQVGQTADRLQQVGIVQDAHHKVDSVGAETFQNLSTKTKPVNKKKCDHLHDDISWITMKAMTTDR